MKKLTRSTLKKTEQFIKEEGRDLEKYCLENIFQNGFDDKVAEALKNYQNEDGGFGNALEPDFRLPNSSPLATSIALRYLKEVDTPLESQDMIKSAVRYLEQSYVEERKGWYAVPKEVNNYPHAWWWRWNENDEMTIIDKHWGNPSAEIIAYLYRYRNYSKRLDIDRLIDHAIKYMRDKEKFKSENELYCYIHLYEELGRRDKKRLKNHITRGVEQVVVYDEDKWTEYVPKPLDFVDDPNKANFGISEDKIQRNLEFLIKKLEEEKVLTPNWDTSVYEGDFKQAIDEWKGILTLEVLKVLDNYGLIEK